MDFIKFSDASAPALNALASPINNEAQIAEVPPCFLAAIVARETGGRNVLQDGADPKTGLLPDGTTAGVGLCQITSGVDWSNPADPTYQGYHLLKEDENLYVAGAFFLKGLLASAHRLAVYNPAGFQASCRGQLVYAAAAGYNEGWGAVLKRVAQGVDCDNGTTDGYAHWVYAKYIEFLNASHAAVRP